MEDTPISLDMGSNAGLDGLTQFGSTSALLSSTVDGGMLGTVASVKISDKGVVSAVFDDGTSRPIYQLPLATFQNPDGLTRISGNAYLVSEQSGNVAINEPGTVGGGTLSASMLEASNVDLAAEFSNMILFQRAYTTKATTAFGASTDDATITALAGTDSAVAATAASDLSDIRDSGARRRNANGKSAIVWVAAPARGRAAR